MPADRKSGRLTVQFYVLKNVHWAMFEELFHYLRARPDVGEIILCLPSPSLLKSGQSHDLAERLLALDATITTHPAERPADVTFIADTVAGRVQGCGLIVNVGHGTISKGYYFTDSLWTERENWVDLLCVPGPYAKARFDGLLRTRVAATGMPKLDPIFSGRHTREALCRRYGLDPATRLVLYAPTFNEDLSSVYLFRDRFAEIARAGRTVLVKLHGSTGADTVEHYRALAAATPGLVFIDDPNIAPCLGGADVLISDVSSVAMEFMALDKPVILYNNPAMTAYHGYNPADIEHAWRDMATEVASFDELLTVVQRVEQAGDDRSARRRGYAAQLFADVEGRASERVWQASLDALAARTRTAPLVPTLSLLAVVTPDNVFLVQRALWQLQFYSVMPLELLLVRQGSSPALDALDASLRAHSHFLSVRVTRAAAPADLTRAVDAAVAESRGEFVLITRDDVLLYRGFDYLLYKTFMHHPDAAALTGVSHAAGSTSAARFARGPLDGMVNERAAYQFINWHEGRHVAAYEEAAMPPMLAVRRAACAEGHLGFGACLQRLIRAGGIQIAPSVFYGVLPRSLTQSMREYLAAKDVDRLTRARDVLRSGAFALFPEVAERLLADFAKIGASGDEIDAIGAFCLRHDEFDLAAHRRLRTIAARAPALARRLDATIALLRHLHARTARAPVGGSSSGGGALTGAVAYAAAPAGVL